MRFMFAPFEPMSRRATWKSLSFSIPIRKRHVYLRAPFMWPCLSSAGWPTMLVVPGVLDGSTGTFPGHAVEVDGIRPGVGYGIPGNGGDGFWLTQLIRSVPSSPWSCLPSRSVIAACASCALWNVTSALLHASSTETCLTAPYLRKTLWMSSSVSWYWNFIPSTDTLTVGSMDIGGEYGVIPGNGTGGIPMLTPPMPCCCTCWKYCSMET
mmetsp:Transcript_47823/g.135072  ORF Transcript_47823/g.135072 Transcript_47823/m.135072 type:complete len:210 (+) Transcript_47823:253-882(+)